MQTAQCPSCGETALEITSPRGGDCSRCGAQFRDGQRICPACNTPNPLDLETCQNCGEPLTIFGTVMARQNPHATPYRLEQMRGQAEGIKARSNQEAELRMTQFREIDQRRLDAERIAQIQQEEKDRLLLRNVLLGIGIFLGLVAIIALIVIL
jgi:hypothetical protein